MEGPSWFTMGTYVHPVLRNWLHGDSSYDSTLQQISCSRVTAVPSVIALVSYYNSCSMHCFSVPWI